MADDETPVIASNVCGSGDVRQHVCLSAVSGWNRLDKLKIRGKNGNRNH